VPEEASQNHELIFILKEQEQNLSFSIEEYEAIEEPAKLVEDFANKMRVELDEIIAQAEGTTVGEMLKEKKAELTEHYDEFTKLSAKEQALVARILTTNFDEEINTAKKRAAKVMNELSCSDSKNMLNAQLRTSTKAILGVATGALMLGTPLAPLGIIVTGVSAANLLIALDPLINRIGDFINACFVRDETLLESVSSSKMNARVLNTQQSLIFSHGEEQSFLIKAKYDLESDFADLLSEVRTALEPVFSKLPADWVDQISIEDYSETKIEEPSLYNIVNISDNRIEVSSNTTSEELALEFSFLESDMPTDDQAFNFELLNTEDSEEPTVIEATLKPVKPITYNMQVSVEAGESVMDTLKADYAASFTIESNPANGTLTLLDAEQALLISVSLHLALTQLCTTIIFMMRDLLRSVMER